VSRLTAITVLGGLLLILLTPASRAQSDVPRFELGGHSTFISFQHTYPNAEQAGIGATATWNLNSHLALDSAIDFLPTSLGVANPNGGGSILQSVAGLKAGVRKSRFGLFAKVRAGFFDVTAFETTSFNPPAAAFVRLIQPELDLGAVAEVCISRRLSLRYDLGDTMVFYGKRTINQGGTSITAIGSRTLQNFQFSAGIAFRF
jgi:hypothetical protein